MPTTARAIRIPDDLWAAALRTAERRQTTVTAVVIAALQQFTQPTKPKDTARP